MPATYNDYQPCMATKYESFELPTIQLIKYKQSVYTWKYKNNDTVGTY